MDDELLDTGPIDLGPGPTLPELAARAVALAEAALERRPDRDAEILAELVGVRRRIERLEALDERVRGCEASQSVAPARSIGGGAVGAGAVVAIVELIRAVLGAL